MSVSNVIILILFIVLSFFWVQWRNSVRANYIRTCKFPPGVYEKLRKKRPELSLKECQLVGQALRQFFLAYLQGDRRFVAMPSQVTDDLWHELILYTRHYQGFCRRAFGGFLHHTPAVVLSRDKQNNTGLRRIWWFACKEENINPRMPTRLPLLFAVDKKLNIADGFFYAPDCQALTRNSAGSQHCGGDFSSTDFDGSTDGFGDSSDGGDSGNSVDSGCGGGCGGD